MKTFERLDQLAAAIQLCNLSRDEIKKRYEKGPTPFGNGWSEAQLDALFAYAETGYPDTLIKLVVEDPAFARARELGVE